MMYFDADAVRHTTTNVYQEFSICCTDVPLEASVKATHHFPCGRSQLHPAGLPSSFTVYFVQLTVISSTVTSHAGDFYADARDPRNHICRLSHAIFCWLGKDNFYSNSTHVLNGWPSLENCGLSVFLQSTLVASHAKANNYNCSSRELFHNRCVRRCNWCFTQFTGS